MKKSFKEFVAAKNKLQEADESANKDWKKEFIQLQKGFIPPPKMRPVVQAFLNSGNIKLMDDTSGKPITMKKKALYLVGGPVRDFLSGKTIKDFDLATNATPEQQALILSSAGFNMSPDRSGKDEKQSKPLRLTFKPKQAKSGDKIAKIINLKTIKTDSRK